MARAKAKKAQTPFEELADACGDLTPTRKETYGEFVVRVCEAVSALKRPDYDGLSEEIHEWTTAAFEAVNEEEPEKAPMLDGFPIERPEDEDEAPAPKAKAKGKAKAAPVEEDDDEVPAPKAKAKAKAKVVEEDEDDDPAPKAKLKPKSKVVEDEDDDEPAPKAKLKTKVAPVEEDDDEDVIAPKAKAKPAPVSAKVQGKTKRTIDEDDDGEGDEDAPPAKAKPKLKAKAAAEDDDEESPKRVSANRVFRELVLSNLEHPYDRVVRMARKQGITAADTHLLRIWQNTMDVIKAMERLEMFSREG